MSSGATPYRSNGSAYSNKENVLNGEANSIGSMPECGIQTNATPINSLGNGNTRRSQLSTMRIIILLGIR